MPAQEIEVALAQVAAGSDAEALHLRRRSRADAVEFADRQARDEVGTHAPGDYELATRLVLVGGELGVALVVGDAGPGGQAGGFETPVANLLDDPRGLWHPLQVLSDVPIVPVPFHLLAPT